MAIPSSSSPQTANNGKSSATIFSSTPIHNLHSNIFSKRETLQNSLNFSATTTMITSLTATTTTTTATTSRSQIYPQQGPHCDQFLKKMGLAKGDTSETEDHHCDMSYVNITCTRWRAYCIKMQNILSRGEPICIEVYLGPVGHKILLEQWIITQKEKQPPPTMTLPSLCSAIRSQLYFSQISAWCDLIKKSDKTIYETGRVIYTTPPTTSAAGDLATTITNNAITTLSTTATSTTSTHSSNTSIASSAATPLIVGSGIGGGGGVGSGGSIGVGCGKRRPSSPRLNIFYRIKQYDSTACFNSKPNVHNFPNVNISENCSVSVCLKSLPRITGGIPKIGTLTTQQQQNSPTIATGLTVISTSPPVASSTPSLAAKSKSIAEAPVPAPTSASAIVASSKATTSAISNAAVVTVATATTITTNAKKPTNLIMNCDNILKEHQQHQHLQQIQIQKQKQQKTITASSTSSRCSFSNNSNNSKQHAHTAIEDAYDNDHDHDHNIDFEYEQTIDFGAGGDGSGFGGGCGSVVDYDSSNSSFSTNNCGNLSHREKQLLKYRKRMLKRDKKQQQRKTNEFSSTHITSTETDNTNNKMEQGEDDDNENDIDDDNDSVSDAVEDEGKSSVKHIAKGQRQHLPNNYINSIPSATTQMQQQQQHQQQQHHVKMISTGTQTIINTCTSCGSEKSMICLKCNPLRNNNDTVNNVTVNIAAVAVAAAATDLSSLSTSSYPYEEEMDAESSSASSLSSSDIIHIPRNKAELLLQAIQRTPKSNKKHKHKSKDSNQMAAIKQQHPQQQQTQIIPTTLITNNNHVKTSPHNTNNTNSSSGSSSSRSSMNGVVKESSNISSNSGSSGSSVGKGSLSSIVACQVCKRQKTQHHFNQPSVEDINSEENSQANSSLNSSNTTVAHNTNVNKSDDDAADADNGDDNETDGGKMSSPSNDCVGNVAVVMGDDDDDSIANNMAKVSPTNSCDNFNENDVMEEEYFESSTKITPHIDRCSLNTKVYYAQMQRPTATTTNGRGESERQRSCLTPTFIEQTENSSNCESATTMMAQFKTPTPSDQHQQVMKSKLEQQPLQPHKQTPKPNLLHITCNFNKNDEQQMQILKSNNISANNTPTTHNPLLLRRSLPKVNLTPIFCNPSSMMVVSSSPIPIGNGVCNGTGNSSCLTTKSADISLTEASPTFSFESPSSLAPSLTVQKSNSAPTLPNSPSLSPRFVKASAIYKRRSRHLSDRSDRSSLGSDEQFSDEDIDSGMYSPFATSPVKLRTRLAAVFGRKPLLGNLEECLLQRRLVPKIEVMGFKLLLGASGGFCPTQLTIPAAAYFYELKGETLSTPYMCEIRLPRKGYTVPRCGTVQATLLNPMGTVVRMFVIPYDMRDMPTLHQTFIRQRILADSGIQSNNYINENGGGDAGDKQFNDDVGGGNAKINTKQLQLQQQQQEQQQQQQQPQQFSPQCNNENHLGHFISAENMKSLRYSIHLRFQTSRTGRLMLHTDIRLLISRRTDCDTAAAHAKGVLEAPNELITNIVMPTNPKYSARQDQTSSKI